MKLGSSLLCVAVHVNKQFCLQQKAHEPDSRIYVLRDLRDLPTGSMCFNLAKDQ